MVHALPGEALRCPPAEVFDKTFNLVRKSFFFDGEDILFKGRTWGKGKVVDIVSPCTGT